MKTWHTGHLWPKAELIIWPGARQNPTLHAEISPNILRNPQVGMQKGTDPPCPWKGNSMDHFSCLSIYSHSESLKMKAPSSLGPTVSAQDLYSPRLILFGIHPVVCVLSPSAWGLGRYSGGVDSCEPLSGWKTLCNMNQLITTHESSTWRADRAGGSCRVSARAAGACVSPWLPTQGKYRASGWGLTHKQWCCFLSLNQVVNVLLFKTWHILLISWIDSFFRLYSSPEYAVKETQKAAYDIVSTFKDLIS